MRLEESLSASAPLRWVESRLPPAAPSLTTVANLVTQSYTPPRRSPLLRTASPQLTHTLLPRLPCGVAIRRNETPAVKWILSAMHRRTAKGQTVPERSR
jgi:hypothetical protein